MKSCHAFKNDATEELYGHMVASPHETPNNASLNRARNGGRRTESRDQKGACFLLCLWYTFVGSTHFKLGFLSHFNLNYIIFTLKTRLVDSCKTKKLKIAYFDELM